VLDNVVEKLSHVRDILPGVATLISNEHNIAQAVAEADLLVNAVLIPGGKAPKLVTEKMVMSMKPGSVIVDVAIDQGGSVETIDRLTSHEDPYFIKHGVVHYSVPNMPGAVPRTSSLALSNATMPYALEIANKGAEAAIRENPALLKGLNVYKGKITNEPVAQAQNLHYEPVVFN
jgi:alanine dehydrogenase